MPDKPAPWDTYEPRPFFGGKPLVAANDVPPAFLLWALDAQGWTWRQYLAWAKTHPRHCHDAPPC